MMRSLLMMMLVLGLIGEMPLAASPGADTAPFLNPMSQTPDAHTTLKTRVDVNDRVVVTLKSGPFLSGQVLQMTDSTVMLSSADAPLELVQQQSLPLIVSEVPVVIHRVDGTLISGQIVRVTERQVVIQTRGDARRVIVNRDEIVAMPRRGRKDREVQVALRWAEIDTLDRRVPVQRSPSSETNRMMVQFLLGSSISGIAGIGAGLLFIPWCDDYCTEDDDSRAMVAVVAASGVYLLTNAAVVYAFGKHFDKPDHGSFGGTFGGTLAGTALLGGVLYGLRDRGSPMLYVILSLALPTLGSIMGYNLSRPQTSSLLNIHDGRLEWGLPTPTLYATRLSHDQSAIGYHVSLVNVRF